MKHNILHLFFILISVTVLCMTFISCNDPHTHNWESKIETMPTCEEEGVVVKTCVLCGATEKESVAATGHKKGVEKTVIEAGCLTEGKIDIVCPDCGKIYESKTVPAKGHVPGTLEITKAATCTETGTEESICTVCGNYIGLREIPAKGHNDKNVIRSRAIEPTCEEEGTINKICPDCLQTIGTEKIPALGHDWGDIQDDVPATCTQEGSKYQLCSRNAEHKKTIVVPMLAHDYTGTTKIIKDATCTESGLIEVACVNCTNTTTITTEALGHKYNEKPDITTIEPSDYAPGEALWRCTVCGNEKREELPPTHVHLEKEAANWQGFDKNGNATVATCTEPAKEYAYCTCFVDENGNLYGDAGAGRFAYPICDEAGNQYVRYVGEKNPGNHIFLEDVQEELNSYFVGKIHVTKCPGCGYEAIDSFIPQGKVSMTGVWEGEASATTDQKIPGMSEVETKSCALRYELYENGKAVVNNILKALGSNQETLFSMDVFEELPAEANIKRTVDGRWISNQWETGMKKRSETEYARFLYIKVSETEDMSLQVVSENPDNKTIRAVIMNEGSEARGTDITRKDLPSDKGILTIDAEGLSTFESFKTEDGTNVIKVAPGTEVSLAWVDLTDTPAASWTWTDNGNQTTTSNSYTFTEASVADHAVTCTAAGETHKVIIRFVNPS